MALNNSLTFFANFFLPIDLLLTLNFQSQQAPMKASSNLCNFMLICLFHVIYFSQNPFTSFSKIMKLLQCPIECNLLFKVLFSPTVRIKQSLFCTPYKPNFCFGLSKIVNFLSTKIVSYSTFYIWEQQEYLLCSKHSLLIFNINHALLCVKYIYLYTCYV